MYYGMQQQQQHQKVHKPPVLVLGYFHMRNLGDDLYCDIWAYLFGERYADLSVDLVMESLESDASDVATRWRELRGNGLPRCIILGGGDVVTEYFITRMRNFVHALAMHNYGWYDVPVHGVSVAMPYPNVVNLGCCDFFSSVAVRPCRYSDHLKARIGRDAVIRMPDLSCFLLTMHTDSEKIVQAALQQTARSDRAVRVPGVRRSADSADALAVCLAAPVLGYGTPQYAANLDGFSKALQAFQRRSKCRVVFVPFDTSGGGSDDRAAIDDILFRVPVEDRSFYSIFFLDAAHTAENVFKRFQAGDLRAALCMRYHAHMMAILAMVPVTSIAVTQKVKSLVDDVLVTLPCTYAPELDGKDVPVTFDASKIVDCLTWTWHNARMVARHEAMYVQGLFARRIPKCDEIMRGVLSGRRRANATSIRDVLFAGEIAEDCVRQVCQYYVGQKDEVVSDFVGRLATGADDASLAAFLSSQGIPVDTVDAAFVATMVCTYITHDMYPSYHYGLATKVLQSTRLLEELKWIVEENAGLIAKQRIASNFVDILQQLQPAAPLFQCRSLGRPSLWGLHRAGWEFVLKNIAHLHANDSTLPIFDDYLDATFNWMNDVLRALDIIPYRRTWFGFFHHTANTECGPNNLVNVFRNPSFLQSLPSCRAILTMSKHLASDVRARLQHAGFASVPVYDLVHPSEIPDRGFSMSAFMQNDHRRLVQIGCWYREPYMLYTLDIPYKNWIRKAALRGRHMQGNFPPRHLSIHATSDDPPVDVQLVLQGVEDERHQCDDAAPPPYSMCRPGNDTQNAYVTNMLKTIASNQHSVEVIQHLDNDGYDELFVKNIIFLHMIDAGAVNTLVEAILRNTPLLVNRLPAIEEVLGDAYPLYYSGPTEASMLACNTRRIADAHAYLKRMDKTPFHVNTFVDNFSKIVAAVTKA